METKKNQLVLFAPAKINLALDILRRRPDGYHDLAMVMQTVSLFDTVTVRVEPVPVTLAVPVAPLVINAMCALFSVTADAPVYVTV